MHLMPLLTLSYVLHSGPANITGHDLWWHWQFCLGLIALVVSIGAGSHHVQNTVLAVSHSIAKYGCCNNKVQHILQSYVFLYSILDFGRILWENASHAFLDPILCILHSAFVWSLPSTVSRHVASCYPRFAGVIMILVVCINVVWLMLFHCCRFYPFIQCTVFVVMIAA